MHESTSEPLILLTGATGYIGGRLLQTLEHDGLRVRCLARDPARLEPDRAETTEIVRGDVMKSADLEAAMAGVTHAYYLVHSMAGDAEFTERDRVGARNFANAAKAAGVQRLVYLGGLGTGDNLSPHLASRQEVGRILQESGVPTIEFRAAVVIGSGSISFEMIRALVEHLPVMIAPRWVRIRTQPLAIEDLIKFLRRALDVPLDHSQIFEIGGSERVTYEDLMLEYARQRGLKRKLIGVPFLTPGLSSLWLGLVTPIYARVGRALIDSLPFETVVHDEQAKAVFGVEPMGVKQAIGRALMNEDREYAATRWSDARSSTNQPSDAVPSTGPRLVDTRAITVAKTPEEAFKPIEGLGGNRGWYRSTILWRLRGLLDLVVGGAGMRRGRRHPTSLIVGDTLDFWRVEAIERGRLLRLSAEMKLPGRAWLQFEVDSTPDGGATIRQTAIYDPVGVLGLAYWYGLWPIHNWVFGDLLKSIAAASTSQPKQDLAPQP